MTDQEITGAFNEQGKAWSFGYHGNAFYKARVKYGELQFRDGFGKWSGVSVKTRFAIIATLEVPAHA